MQKYICKCQDSAGTPHNKKMTKKEYNQDGMCAKCADHVWAEMEYPDFKWYHPKQTENTKLL